MHCQHQRTGAGKRNHREVANRIKRQLAVQRRIDGMAAGDQCDGVTVGGGTCRELGADDAVGAGAVFNNDLLLETVGQLCRDRAADDVITAARGKRRNDADRTRGISLLCKGGQGRCCRQQRGKQQRLARRCLPFALSHADAG